VRRFGDAGLLIETETYVDDLPMTDCFYVADRIRIEPLSDAKDNKTTVVITMEFGITFVKSTMFRGIITRQTTSEFNALFKAMVQYMSDALINDIGATVKDDNAKGLPASSDINGQVDTDASALPTTLPFETVPVSDQSEPKQSFSWGHSISWTPDRIVLVIVLLLQLWLLFELRSIKQSLLYVSLRDDVSHNGQCSIGGV
jgi:VAD1 Analog of StAR-related lipid transfer domain